MSSPPHFDWYLAARTQPHLLQFRLDLRHAMEPNLHLDHKLKSSTGLVPSGPRFVSMYTTFTNVHKNVMIWLIQGSLSARRYLLDLMSQNSGPVCPGHLCCTSRWRYKQFCLTSRLFNHKRRKVEQINHEPPHILIYTDQSGLFNARRYFANSVKRSHIIVEILFYQEHWLCIWESCVSLSNMSAFITDC